MKKFFSVLLICALFASALIPVSAADGELLIEVNFLTDEFITVHTMNLNTYDFSEKFDLSNVTPDTFMIQKNTACTNTVWEDCVWYIENSGYYVTEDTKYTVYFEVASPHSGKYSGIPIIREGDEFGLYAMLWGSFSDNGDNKDSDGNYWSEARYVYNYGEMKYQLGTGYNSNNLSYFHPAFQVDSITDNCKTEITEAKFATLKFEYNGLYITTFYLDDLNNWVRLENDGYPMEYITEYGSEIILGTYSRNQERHNIIRNIKLLQGTGLSYTEIQNAQQTSEPKPPKPETAAATTAAPVPTQAPTEAPVVTDAPTAAPVATNAPEATATEAVSEKKGCGSAVVFLPVTAALTVGCVVLRKKKH